MIKVRWLKDQPAASVTLACAALILVLLLGACSSDTVPVSEATSGDSVPTSEPESEANLPTVTPENVPDNSSEIASDATPDSAEAAEIEQIRVDELGIDLVPVITDLREPLYITHAGDGSGRKFIVEQEGTIRIERDGELLDTPFLDIRDRVERGGSEMGLLGMAFPPNYAETGDFFVNYTGGGRQTQIARFSTMTDDPDRADPDSEFTILQLDQPATNHNGGMLAFGPDGFLYIGTGDGGASFDRFGNGQNPATLLGKMLRIDVTTDPSVPYVIPEDNPWVDQDLDGADVRDEIWAIGLRNPWRYSFDRGSGDFWIADVGQNQFEEVNLTPSGASGGMNFGWPIQEGTHCINNGCSTDGLVQPILEYSHAGGHCSITGGYVLRDSEFPELNGVYFYGDYCSGTIWAAAEGDAGNWNSSIVANVNARISSFGEDEEGRLYLTDLGGGTVYRLVPSE